MGAIWYRKYGTTISSRSKYASLHQILEIYGPDECQRCKRTGGYGSSGCSPRIQSAFVNREGNGCIFWSSAPSRKRRFTSNNRINDMCVRKFWGRSFELARGQGETRTIAVLWESQTQWMTLHDVGMIVMLELVNSKTFHQETTMFKERLTKTRFGKGQNKTLQHQTSCPPHTPLP